LANHQNLHITLTVLISVALSCGALYWSDKTATPAPRAFTPAAAAPAVPSVESTSPTRRPAIAQPIEAASGKVQERAPAAAPTKAQETPPSNYDGPVLPVVFAFSERYVYTTEDNEEGNPVNVSKRVKEGIISNTSDKPLTITATEVNIATQETSQTQIVLGAGTQRHFGTDLGLKMISGDQMTLRSPSFRDLVQQIP
jgi:hypothetical protein